MEGFKRRPIRGTVHREVWRVQNRSKRSIEERERPALRNIVKHLEKYGGLGGRYGMKTYLHGPMDYAKKKETVISCRGPGPTRKKQIFQ